MQEIVLICADALYFLPGLGLIFLQPDKHTGIETADARSLDRIVLVIRYLGMDLVVHFDVAQVLPADHAVANYISVLVQKYHCRALRGKAHCENVCRINFGLLHCLLADVEERVRNLRHILLDVARLRIVGRILLVRRGHQMTLRVKNAYLCPGCSLINTDQIFCHFTTSFQKMFSPFFSIIFRSVSIIQMSSGVVTLMLDSESLIK